MLFAMMGIRKLCILLLFLHCPVFRNGTSGVILLLLRHQRISNHIRTLKKFCSPRPSHSLNFGDQSAPRVGVRFDTARVYLVRRCLQLSRNVSD
jgi:hypothetical protein